MSDIEGEVRMLNAKDKENFVKSSQAVNILVQNLCDLMEAENQLLAKIAIEIFHQAVQIEQRLNQINLTASSEEKIK